MNLMSGSRIALLINDTYFGEGNTLRKAVPHGYYLATIRRIKGNHIKVMDVVLDYMNAFGTLTLNSHCLLGMIRRYEHYGKPVEKSKLCAWFSEVFVDMRTMPEFKETKSYKPEASFLETVQVRKEGRACNIQMNEHNIKLDRMELWKISVLRDKESAYIESIEGNKMRVFKEGDMLFFNCCEQHIPLGRVKAKMLQTH